LYTDAERDYCQGRIPCLGVRFAVKEAVAKALGTGFRGVCPIEIETRNSSSGKPLLQLYGTAAKVAKELGIKHWEISLSHEEFHAIAIAVAIRQNYSAEGLQKAVADTVQVAFQYRDKATWKG